MTDTNTRHALYSSTPRTLTIQLVERHTAYGKMKYQIKLENFNINGIEWFDAPVLGDDMGETYIINPSNSHIEHPKVGPPYNQTPINTATYVENNTTSTAPRTQNVRQTVDAGQTQRKLDFSEKDATKDK